MNAEIERALQQLIDEHGIDKIDKALEPLIAKVPWQDWQRVYNLAHRLNRRKSGQRRKRTL